MRAFLREIEDRAEQNNPPTLPGVTLATLHAAKGLEWNHLFLIGVAEGVLPMGNDLNEERRLFYVGITRAKERLYISLALTRSLYGESDSTIPSRYLQEIPQHIIEWRESGAGSGSAPRRYTPSIAEDSGYRIAASPKPKSQWAGAITSVRNNEGLQLAVGDQVEHEAFGHGKVVAVQGEGSKQTAEIRFDAHGVKRLLVKVAPIQKL